MEGDFSKHIAISWLMILICALRLALQPFELQDNGVFWLLRRSLPAPGRLCRQVRVFFIQDGIFLLQFPCLLLDLIELPLQVPSHQIACSSENECIARYGAKEGEKIEPAANPFHTFIFGRMAGLIRRFRRYAQIKKNGSVACNGAPDASFFLPPLKC